MWEAVMTTGDLVLDVLVSVLVALAAPLAM
jgi:hypothetical protein